MSLSTYCQDLGSAEDRPLLVQLCGYDPDVLLKASRYVEHLCDGIDLNLGCPQGIARRGKYGAFLLERKDLVLKIVRTLSANLKVGWCCHFLGAPPSVMVCCSRRPTTGANVSVCACHAST